MVMYLQSNCCVIPEHIHSQPKVVIGNSKGWCSKTKKTSLEKEGGGGGGGVMDIFWNHTFYEKSGITTVSPKFTVKLSEAYPSRLH